MNGAHWRSLKPPPQAQAKGPGRPGAPIKGAFSAEVRKGPAGALRPPGAPQLERCPVKRSKSPDLRIVPLQKIEIVMFALIALRCAACRAPPHCRSAQMVAVTPSVPPSKPTERRCDRCHSRRLYVTYSSCATQAPALARSVSASSLARDCAFCSTLRTNIAIINTNVANITTVISIISVLGAGLRVLQHNATVA